jgi:hypothetical protein
VGFILIFILSSVKVVDNSKTAGIIGGKKGKTGDFGREKCR